MHDNTHKVLSEKYEQVQEGFMDRAKAKTAGLAGKLSGVKTRAGATLRGTAAGYKGDAYKVAQAGREKALANVKGQLAAIDSYSATVYSKISNLSAEIARDLRKLNIPQEVIDQKAFADINYAMQKAFLNVKQAIEDKAYASVSTPSAPGTITTT